MDAPPSQTLQRHLRDLLQLLVNFSFALVNQVRHEHGCYGIRMVRDINSHYLTELAPLFPSYRLSEEGDFPKVGCATCHKGAYKPLYGVSMLPDYPELAKEITYEKSSVPVKPYAATDERH